MEKGSKGRRGEEEGEEMRRGEEERRGMRKRGEIKVSVEESTFMVLSLVKTLTL